MLILASHILSLMWMPSSGAPAGDIIFEAMSLAGEEI